MCENCEETKARREALRNKLQTVIEQIETLMKANKDSEEEKNIITDNMKLIEIKIREEISNAETDGKKLYTNSEQRESATFLRLNDNKAYAKMKNDLKTIIKNKTEYEVALEVLKYKFRGIQALIELEKMEI